MCEQKEILKEVDYGFKHIFSFGDGDECPE